MARPGGLRVAALTAAALVGFAGNSLLCRGALGGGSIDAGSFTAIRIATGAAVLAALVAWWPSSRATAREAARAGSWASAAALVAYAAAFSFAYLRLGAATGALILFGVVQATMIGSGLRRGERPAVAEWLGLAIAAAGLIGLTLPGLAAPDPLGAALMAAAGVAWGIYSLRGRGVTRPVVATAANFVRSVPLAAALVAVTLATSAGAAVSARGALLAAASGAIASGLGYSLWYAALPHLTATRAAIVQLAVPVVTAAGAVALLGEPVDLRIVLAGLAILGGVALAALGPR